MLSPEDLKQILNAFEQLDWVQELKEMLEERRTARGHEGSEEGGALPEEEGGGARRQRKGEPSEYPEEEEEYPEGEEGGELPRKARAKRRKSPAERYGAHCSVPPGSAKRGRHYAAGGTATPAAPQTAGQRRPDAILPRDGRSLPASAGERPAPEAGGRRNGLAGQRRAAAGPLRLEPAPGDEPHEGSRTLQVRQDGRPGVRRARRGDPRQLHADPGRRLVPGPRGARFLARTAAAAARSGTRRKSSTRPSSTAPTSNWPARSSATKRCWRHSPPAAPRSDQFAPAGQVPSNPIPREKDKKSWPTAPTTWRTATFCRVCSSRSTLPAPDKPPIRPTRKSSRRPPARSRWASRKPARSTRRRPASPTSMPPRPATWCRSSARANRESRSCSPVRFPPAQLLKPDTSGNGTAIAVNMSGGGLQYYGARAMEYGVSGEKIRVQVEFGAITT